MCPLRYPKASAREAPPLRAERHNPASITTQRSVTARILIATLSYCPACGMNGSRAKSTTL